MKAFSISFRIAATWCCISVLELALFGTIMWFILYNSVISWKDRSLQLRADRVEALLLAPQVGQPASIDARLNELVGILPEGQLIQIVRSNGERAYPVNRDVPEPLLPAAPCPEPYVRDAIAGKGHFRQLCRPVTVVGIPEFLLVPSSLTEERILLRNFNSGVYEVVPFILLMSGTLGYTLSRRALRPVDVLIEEASTITAADLSRRITVTPADDQLRRLALEWNHLLSRIEAAMTRVTQFTADASHELRNPIAYIQATAEYSLNNQGIDDESREAFRAILNETRMTTGLLENLLTLARPNVAISTMDIEQIDVRSAIQEVSDHFASQMQKKQQTLAVCGPKGIGAGLRMDAHHFRRILTALLDNAIKYTPEKGRVEVSFEMKEGLRLWVTDTGIGIAAEHLDRVFDRFYRIDEARSEMSDGVGLGLPIAKFLAELYGGNICIESRPDKGTTVTLTFPENIVEVAPTGELS